MKRFPRPLDKLFKDRWDKAQAAGKDMHLEQLTMSFAALLVQSGLGVGDSFARAEQLAKKPREFAESLHKMANAYLESPSAQSPK